MSEVIQTTVKYYDIGDKEFKGGAKLHKIKATDDKNYSAFVKGDALANQGDTVKMAVFENDKGYLNFDPKKFKVLERGKGHQQPKGNGGDERQESILRQSSVNYAANIMSALIGQGRYDSVSDEEIVEQTIYLADSFILPYTSEGKKPEDKEPVSDFDGGNDWDVAGPDVGDGDNVPPF